MSTFVLCVGCGIPLSGFSPCQWCTSELCGNDLGDGFCSLCNSRNSCVYDPNPNSFDCPPDSCHPPHPTYETYSCDSYGNDSHFGYDFQLQFPLNYESKPGYIENYNSYPYDSSSLPQQYPCCEDYGVLSEADHCQTPQYTVNQPIFNAHNDLLSSQTTLMEQMTSLTSMCEMACQIIQKKQGEKKIKEEQAANARYWKIPFCCDDDDDYNSAITPNEPVDSLSMGDEHIDTISAMESDEFIKSSVKNLIPNPSEFEDECECDMPDCDDSQTTNFSTFTNPLFDDSTSSDDESSHVEVIHEISFKTYSNSFFDLDEEINSSEFNPIHNEDLNSTPKNDRFDTKSYLLESLLNRDESIPPGIDSDDSDSEGDTLSLERLLHDDHVPLPDTLDFSNVV
uniref:Pre-mRNA splicing Prp18-interacting factor n=1 Tax=Tanacetum cinerariifolium TaxID=118510 RepID=A0A6L2NU56_TANCI|nr:pre-mRNA splicing Prp18-interacting factor [Tanacetum cinerariifolium]